MNKLLVAGTLCALVCAAHATAAVHYVAPAAGNVSPFTNWATAATDIQDAIDVAQDDDTVMVTNGTYYPDDTIALTARVDVTLASVNGPTVTIICGDGATEMVFVRNNGVIDGFTVSNGFTTDGSGAGIQVESGVARNCIVTSCRGQYGAGLAISGGSAENCVVRNNEATHAAGGGLLSGGAVVRGCVFEHNSVTGTGPLSNLYYGGGGILCYQGGYMVDCIVRSNTCASMGGGIRVAVSTTVERCTIEDNVAVGDGGGIYFDAGGTVRSSLIVANHALEGGGIYVMTNASVENCTIVGNMATTGGGFRTVVGGSVINSIIYSNSAATASNVFVQGSSLCRYTCTVPPVSNIYGGQGCITSNPVFVAAGNYHLAASSPCVDKGTNMPGIRLLTDRDGDCRVSNIVDMGAYEHSVIAPVVSINNGSATVNFDVGTWVCIGTNSAGINGDMKLTNLLAGVSVSFPRAGNAWTSAPIALAIGTNTLVVLATNTEGYVASDATTIIRTGPGTGAPFVDVTNDHFAVVYDAVDAFISGTNNMNVFGSMWITNTANGDATPFVPVSNWFSVRMLVAPGTNDIYVFGTNLLEVVSTDMVRVVKNVGTGTPFVDITNAPLGDLSYDAATFTAGGTNNMQVVGSMWVVNSSLGVTSAFPATAAWAAPAVPLAVGTNVVVVHGSNLLGTVVQDSAIIVRGGPGTGMPFIECTSDVASVEYTVSSFAFAGTNNQNVVGGMWATNLVNGACVKCPVSDGWTLPAIALDVGLNDIKIVGTNEFGIQYEDVVLLSRKGIATGTPFVDIVTTSMFGSYDFKGVVVDGTNNDQVVGEMWVSNAANQSVQHFGAAQSWSTPMVSLAPGSNVLWVIGENAADDQAWDSVVMVRDIAGTGTPFVDVTNGDHFVTFDAASFAAAGTNNENVLPGGTMIVTNLNNGGSASFLAQAGWIAPAVPLDIGVNLIAVVGTNMYGASATGMATIVRGGPGTGLPFIDAMPSLLGVGAVYEDYVIVGTNNLNVIGTMWLSNMANLSSVTFDAAPSWISPSFPIEFGTNVIVVGGSNLWRDVTNDTIVVVRAEPGSGVPAVFLSTANTSVSFDVFSFPLEGSNNVNVVGGMWVSNVANGATQPFPASIVWTSPPLPLTIGDNPLTVYGTNAGGSVVSATAVVNRGLPGSGTPSVSITNGNIVVGPFVTNYVVAGTNNINVVGGMWISNRGTIISFPASHAWVTPPIELDRHINVVTVVGTNAAGVVTSDTALINRAVPPGVTNYVSNTGSDEWPYLTWETAATNIREAVHEAALSNVVMVGPGVNVACGPIRVDDCVKVTSVSGAAHTIVLYVGTAPSSCFHVVDGVVEDITICPVAGASNAINGGGVLIEADGVLRGCVVSGFFAASYGGGALLNGGLATNCVFTSNSSGWDGGGVFITADGAVVDSVVRDNSAVFGGGAYVYNGGTVHGCTIADNDAVSSSKSADAGRGIKASQARKAAGGDGGGVYIENGGSIDNSRLFGNFAQNGAAVFVRTDGSVTRSTMHHNLAAYYAAAYCVYGGSVESCIIVSNAGGTVGGVMLDSGGRMRNCLVDVNVADEVGGVYLDNGAVMENCTVCRNFSEEAVGGIGTSEGVTIRNAIVYHNVGPDASNYYAYTPGASWSHSCADPLPEGPGNIAVDPLMARANAGFQKLAVNSPCIDSGTNDMAWMATASDLGDNPRVSNAIVDMGAFEFSNGPVIWTASRTIDFGSVLLNQAGIQEIEFGNAGNVVLSGIVFGAGSPFAVNDGSPYALGTLGIETAAFTFVPTEMRAYSNVVTFTGGGSAHVLLTGNGVPEPLAVGTLAVIAMLHLLRRRSR